LSFAKNGDVRLYFETIGRQDAPAVLLLNGAGRQCVDFDEGFCALLTQGGYRVLRFDSRDVGLSTAFVGESARLVQLNADLQAGRSPSLVYGLSELADDAFTVLDAAGAASAHLIGRSIGGMTAQLMAIRKPERVTTLTLIMANSRSVAGELSADHLARLDGEVIADEDAFVERQLRSAKAIGSPAYRDLARLEAEARIAWARGVHKGGIARHFAVALAAPDLRPQLSRILARTLVVHGALDPLIPLSFAKETAAGISGARLEVFDDMAHDAPPEHWRRWASLFLDHAGSASTSSADGA
jgi:pimeloyl-ACP methyl ester carboxylesterase